MTSDADMALMPGQPNTGGDERWDLQIQSSSLWWGGGEGRKGRPWLGQLLLFFAAVVTNRQATPNSEASEWDDALQHWQFLGRSQLVFMHVLSWKYSSSCSKEYCLCMWLFFQKGFSLNLSAACAWKAFLHSASFLWFLSSHPSWEMASLLSVSQDGKLPSSLRDFLYWSCLGVLVQGK